MLITGTDTDVGKTYVAALVARQLVARGLRVGVYKPLASGCRRVGDTIVSDDALALWEAAGRPGSLADVCPQRFIAPLAPSVAARLEGHIVDRGLLRAGRELCAAGRDVLVIEGAGGLFSPVSDDELIADLAIEWREPLVIVAPNRLGAINHALLALHAARSYRGGLRVAAVILNAGAAHSDASSATNAAELRRRINVPLVELSAGATSIALDWFDDPQGSQP